LQYIVFKQNSRGGNFEGYDLEKNRINGQDVFRFQVTSVEGQQVPAASTTIPQPGVWYHLAGTYDGTTVKIYINGVLEGTAVAGFPMDFGTEPVYFGTTGQGFDGRLEGALDEVSIYNRALATNEIAAIYQAGSDGKCSPSTGSSGIPVITSFSPALGAPGTVVNINGLNFSPTVSNNIVYFGAVRATVHLADTTTLVVSVPAGATYAPITETVNGLTAYANKPFVPTFSASAPAKFSLGPQLVLPAGNGPSGVVIADLDGDGKPDVVVDNGNDHTIDIYRNIGANDTLGTNSFAPPVVLSIGNSGEGGMVAADLTGDGKLDLICVDSGSDVVTVLKNLCTPGNITSNSFASPVNFVVGQGPRGVAVQDLNGDGKPEIVSANWQDNSVSVLRNTSTPGIIDSNSFAAGVVFATGTTPQNVMIADMDGDGKPDVVTVDNNYNGGSPGMSVLRNISTATNFDFENHVDFPGAVDTYCLAIGDLDGDRKPDVVVGAQGGNAGGADSMLIYRNTSTPGNISPASFASPVIIPAGGWVNWVSLADLNGDGKLDIAAAMQSPSQLAVYINTSTPGSISNNSFASPQIFASGDNANGLAIGDLNGDGIPDIVFANTYDGTFSFYQNLTPSSGGSGIPPFITIQPTNETVILGGTATFSVAAGGSTPLSYQWYFDDAGITGATNPILTLTDVQPGEAGGYYVTVANAYGPTNSVTVTLTVTSPYLCDPVPSGIISWWPGEGNANDIIGTNNGILDNGVTFTDGVVGEAFHFNGSNQDVQIPYSTSLEPTNITVECWVKLDALASPVSQYPGLQYIVFKQNSRGGNFEGYDLEKNRINGQDVFRFQVTSVYGQQVPAASTTISQPGIWYHLAGTYDGTTVKIYVNGVLEGTAEAGFPMNFGTEPVYFGTTGQGFDGRLEGALDEVSIYNRALSTNEIAAIYQAGSEGKCQPTHPISERFDWKPIASPKFRDMPFKVTITARNPADAIATNYTGRVSIDSSNGIPVFPPISGEFVRGEWTGEIVVLDAATNIELIARDTSGQSGISNPFNVLNRPRLNVIQDHGKWKFLWPAFESGFEPEMTTNLDSGTWVPVPGQYLRDGDQYYQPITPASTNSQVFYRLHFIGQSNPDKDPLKH
jgi:hypothetical protein